MAKILSFDQASRVSGYAVFEDGNLIHFGKFCFDDDDFGVRLKNIRNMVKKLIDTWNPDEIIFEDIQFQSNVGNNVETFKKLAEVFGVIYELVTELDISHRTVLSTVWKSKLKIGGKKRAEQKSNAQKHVLETYGVKATQDESDAICIGEYATLTKDDAANVKAKTGIPMGFDWSN